MAGYLRSKTLKTINNSWREGKENHYREGGLCDPNYHKFGEVLLWISPRIINALRSYIFEVGLKNLACASFFNPLLCVWISDETLVFGVLLLKCRFQTETIEHSPSWFVCYIVMCTRIPYSCGAPRLVLGGLSLCSGAIRFFSTFYESLSKPHEKKNTVKICIDWNTCFLWKLLIGRGCNRVSFIEFLHIDQHCARKVNIAKWKP